MMTLDSVRERLAFLLETVALEAEHLQATDQRLFAEAFTAERATTLHGDGLLAERLDAFAARFARLQDTIGDKLLPTLLACAASSKCHQRAFPVQRPTGPASLNQPLWHRLCGPAARGLA